MICGPLSPWHLSRLVRRRWSGAISIWISWSISCILATRIYHLQHLQLKKLALFHPFPTRDVIGQSLSNVCFHVFPCVSSIQWHTALLPPLRLQRRVECQSHGKPAIGIRCLPWQIWKRHKATLDPGPGSHIQQTLNGDVWKPQSGISSDVAPVRYCAGSLR